MIILPLGRIIIYIKVIYRLQRISYQSTFKERPSKDGRFKCAMVYKKIDLFFYIVLVIQYIPVKI